jgi:hypothetical protein
MQKSHVIFEQNRFPSIRNTYALLKICTFQYMALSDFIIEYPSAKLNLANNSHFFIFPLGSANSVLLRLYCLLSLLPNICSFQFNKFLYGFQRHRPNVILILLRFKHHRGQNHFRIELRSSARSRVTGSANHFCTVS